MKPQIRQGEMHLTQGGQPGIEGAAVATCFELGPRQRFAGLPVPGHAHQGGSVQAPVLHELAGEFHGIPFDVADACRLRLLHGGEHVLQAMAEFMEEGFHLFEAHQAGRVPDRWGLVADQVGHGKHKRPSSCRRRPRHSSIQAPPRFAGGAAVGIEIETLRSVHRRGSTSEEANVLVPDRR